MQTSGATYCLGIAQDFWKEVPKLLMRTDPTGNFARKHLLSLPYVHISWSLGPKRRNAETLKVGQKK